MPIFDTITFSIAVLGAVLGLLNAWRSLIKDQIRVKITPKLYVPIKGQALTISHLDQAVVAHDPRWQTVYDNTKHLCFEIINLSYLPITISEVGFITNSKISRIVMLKHYCSGNIKLPQRLEPRSSLLIFGSEILGDDQIITIRRGYCETDCGRRFFGRSPALSDLIKRTKKA
jgi:hypothetical protein